MITGAARWPNQQAIGRQMGANEYILKPFDVFRLGERVHQLMGSKRPIQRQWIPTGEPDSPQDGVVAENPAPLPAEGEISAPIIPSPAPAVETQTSQENVFAADPTSFWAVEEVPASVVPPPTSAEETETPQESIVADIPTPFSAVEDVLTPIDPPPASPNGKPIAAGSPVDSTKEDEQRFFDFSVEILILSSQLSKSRAGRYTADQLIHSGTSVGARIQESFSAENQEDRIRILRSALKNLRETGYWLMIIRKAGILEVPALVNLETQCRELAAVLTEQVIPLTHIS